MHNRETNTAASADASALKQDGFFIATELLLEAVLTELRGIFAAPMSGLSGGIRNVLTTHPAARSVAMSSVVQALVAEAGGPEAYAAVRGILFDKTASPDGVNWKVPFHQDLSIAVRHRPAYPVEGFETWSVKEGVPHVQAPVDLLERMITVRLHLDDCDAQTGALRVLSGSHRLGRLSTAEVGRLRTQAEETVCPVPAGGAMVFRPLLLHASSPATRPDARRRVLHLEFAPMAYALPPGIEWHERVAPIKNREPNPRDRC